MRPCWLHLLLFALFLLASVIVLRLALGTIAGMVIAFAILAARLLWILYGWTETSTILLWTFSAEMAERFAEARQARLDTKESRHAARLL